MITESSSNIIPLNRDRIIDHERDPAFDELHQAQDDRPRRFRPVALDDVKPRAGGRWLIQDILPARGLACIVGAPKSGKSYLAMDMMCALARGVAYVGRKTEQVTVLYCTGEGVQGFEDRLIAMRQHLGIEGDDVPFYMLPEVPDLGSETCDLAHFIEDINEEFLFAIEDGPHVIVIDTLARSMGDGDENSARDMGRFVNRCDAIAKHFDCLVTTIHHHGKDPSRGARGSNSLSGAADVVIEVVKSETVNTACVTYSKDGPEGLEWRFRIIPSAHNDGGAHTTACIVKTLSEPSQAHTSAHKRRKPPAGVAGDLFKIIQRAIDESGTVTPDSIRVPRHTRAVSRDDLRRYCKTMGWLDETEPNAWRAAMSTYLSRLRSSGLIDFDIGFVWETQA